MNHKFLFATLGSLLIASIILSYGFLVVDPAKEEPQNFFVGIDVAYENMTEIKSLIDKVSPYTNLFIIGARAIKMSVLYQPAAIITPTPLFAIAAPAYPPISA